MNKKLDMAEFHKLARKGSEIPGAIIRLALSSEPTVEEKSRVATFVFSDNSVDRYGDTIDARGWVLDKFMNNPVALFGHDSGKVEHVIGKARNVRVEGQRLIGEIEFIEASVNPTAETVFQMVKGGYLNAVSVGFAPLEWAMSKDKARPMGVDFKKQELLEISIVPIPANADALVQARAAGIEIDRLALAQRAPAPKVKIKSLSHIAWLADILMDLNFLEDCVEWEAALEEDGSEIPQRLLDALKALGQILIEMTAEEVGELLASGDEDAPVDGVIGVPVGLAASASRMRLLKSLARADSKIVETVIDALAPKQKTGLVDLIAIKAKINTAKAGKVLSSDNEKKLRDAHTQITKGCETIMGVVGSNSSDDDEDDGEEKAIRLRRVRLAEIEAA